jgi:hypothetical protein
MQAKEVGYRDQEVKTRIEEVDDSTAVGGSTTPECNILK